MYTSPAGPPALITHAHTKEPKQTSRPRLLRARNNMIMSARLINAARAAEEYSYVNNSQSPHTHTRIADGLQRDLWLFKGSSHCGVINRASVARRPFRHKQLGNQRWRWQKRPPPPQSQGKLADWKLPPSVYYILTSRRPRRAWPLLLQL